MFNVGSLVFDVHSLLHRQHPVATQKAIHPGFRLADVLDRDGEHLQLHRGLARPAGFQK